MIDLYAAIEFKDGRSRRPCTTHKGTTSDPLDIAKYFVEAGVGGLHLIDRDAIEGRPSRSRVVIAAVAAAVGVPVQVDAGAASKRTVEAMLDTEAERVVMSAKGLDEPGLVEWLGLKYPDRVLVSLDAADETSVQLASQLGVAGVGIVTVQYSSSANMAALVEIVSATSCGVIAIVADEAASEVEELAELEVGGNRHLDGVVIGAPLYAGPGRLSGALEICN